MPRGYSGLTPGVDPRSQGMIPRRFKQKKIFVTNGRKDGRKDGWTDRRVGQNSALDSAYSSVLDSSPGHSYCFSTFFLLGNPY